MANSDDQYFNPQGAAGALTGNDSSLDTDTPDYLRAANMHNIGSSNTSWFGSIADSVENAPKFFTVAAISGANSFYNTGVQIDHMFGGDAEINDTGSFISGLDSDLGAYYQENQKSADTMGFLLSSIIPGVAGIKVLNAGQKALALTRLGNVGSNIGLALGLRTPLMADYITSAATEIAEGQAVYSGLNNSVIKALATGTYQQVLEGAAFETAIQATMHANPVLADQDVSDIAWNVMTGGLLQGAIGGALHAAVTLGKIGEEATGITKQIRPFGSQPLLQETNNTGLETAYLAKSLEEGPTLDPGNPNYAAQVRTLQTRQIQIQNQIRTNVNKMTVGNQLDLGNMAADVLHGEDADTVLQRVAYVDQITNVNGATTVEKELAEAAEETGPITEGTVASAVPVNPDLQVHYWQLTGDNAGRVLDMKPEVYSLADQVAESTGGSIRQKVMSKVRGYGFTLADAWDASVQPLVSMQGTNAAEARQIWAAGISKIPDGQVVHQYDIPVLQKALELGQQDLKVVGSNGKLVQEGFSSPKIMQDFIVQKQKEAALILQVDAVKSGAAYVGGNTMGEAKNWINEKIGKITNVKSAAVEGTGEFGVQDYNARAAAQSDYLKYLQSKGLKPVNSEEADVSFKPSWAKVTKRITGTKLPDGNVVDAMTYFAAVQKTAAQSVVNVVAKALPEQYDRLVEITVDDLSTAQPRGDSASFFGFSNPKQGSLGSKLNSVGAAVRDAKQWGIKQFQEATGGDLSALGRNNGAVVEWSGLGQKTSRSALQWVPMELPGEIGADGVQGANMRGLFSTDAIAAAGKEPLTSDVLDEIEDRTGQDHFIPVEHDETWNVVKGHVAQENKYAQAGNELAAAVGKQQTKQLDIFRPIPANPNDYKFIAFVKDPKVTGQGHTSMIFAENASKLDALVRKAQEARPDLDIHTRGDTQEFYEARGQYQYDRTLSENSIDSSLKNNGIYSDYFLKTDPQAVLDDYMQYHQRRIAAQTTDLVRAQYQPQFDWLEQQARISGGFQTSRIGSNSALLQQTAKNPYLGYIKTGLDLSRADEHPLWTSINKAADIAVSNVVDRVNNIWKDMTGKDPSTPEFKYAVDNTNRTLQRYGLNTGYVDAATQLLVNSKVPQGVLSRFIGSANSLLSRLTLGLDPLNGLNNAVGANVLRMTELTSTLKKIANGDMDQLGKLGYVDLTGQGDPMFSAAKLNAGGIAAYFKAVFAKNPQEVANLALFKRLGVIRDLGTQYRDILDNLTLNGQEVEKDMSLKLSQANQTMDKYMKIGTTVTGNNFLHEQTRFATAWGMKTLTDPLVQSGKLSQAEQYAYINTHVNRVDGNLVASQRPFVFQGPIGQAVGLFQSYQFNLMQQLLRYVAEGGKKDAAMLLGLQGTLYGIQGLPGFQAINQHIIGTASGNKAHTDAYTATYGIAGKNIGDLLMYGLPSNLLQTNLYSRGDLNPRSVTILPTALSDVPIINATMKFFGGVKAVTQKIGSGGNVWESMLQGVEHASLSRPLSGLAQTLQSTTGNHQVMSTTNSDGIMFTNDLLSLATASRLAGGRPIDEALVNDALQRVHTYQQYDHDSMLNLAAAVKSSNINGQQMDGDSVAKFAAGYAASGGKLINFNKFMVNEIKSVKSSAAEKIVTGLQNPYAQGMQQIMGGATAPQSITDAP